MGKTDRGFTLVEMMIVVGLIGILAALVIANAISSRKVARDRARVVNLQVVLGDMKSYIKDGNRPPVPADYGEGTACDGANGWDCSYVDQDTDGAFFLEFLQSSPGDCLESTCPYLKEDPVDPLHIPNTIPASGTYFLYNAFPTPPPDSCPSSFYVLVARLETSGVGEAVNDVSCWNGLYSNDPQAYVIVGMR